MCVACLHARTHACEHTLAQKLIPNMLSEIARTRMRTYFLHPMSCTHVGADCECEFISTPYAFRAHVTASCMECMWHWCAGPARARITITQYVMNRVCVGALLKPITSVWLGARLFMLTGRELVAMRKRAAHSTCVCVCVFCLTIYTRGVIP